jgi:hypothetical protein
MFDRKRLSWALLMVSLAPGLVSAQSATGMAGNVIGGNEQVTNAAQAAEEALKSAATKGEATRGASGAIASLLTSSDKLICSAWIVSFRVRYRNMVIEGADAKSLGAMKTLMEKVEKECDKVLNPEGRQNVKVGGGGGGDEPDEGKAKPIYPLCPECDPFKIALDQRTYEFEHAQYELNKSMRWTDFVEAAHKSGDPESDRWRNARIGGEIRVANASQGLERAHEDGRGAREARGMPGKMQQQEQEEIQFSREQSPDVRPRRWRRGWGRAGR